MWINYKKYVSFSNASNNVLLIGFDLVCIQNKFWITLKFLKAFYALLLVMPLICAQQKHQQFLVICPNPPPLCYGLHIYVCQSFLWNSWIQMSFTILSKRCMLESCRHTYPQAKTSSTTYLHNDETITTISNNLCENF